MLALKADKGQVDAIMLSLKSIQTKNTTPLLSCFCCPSSLQENVPFDWWPSVCACPQQFTLITTSHERFIFPEALLSQDPWLPKSRMWSGSYRSLGPIRASSEHLVVITQSVLLRIPAHQSASIPKLTNPSKVTVLSRCIDKNQGDPQRKWSV